MRTAALVLGIVAGVLGIFAGVIEIIVGGTAQALDVERGGTTTISGFVTFALAIVGLIGGAVAPRSPGWSASLQATAGLAGFLSAGLFWLLSGPLFLVGAVLAFVARRRSRRSVSPAALPS